VKSQGSSLSGSQSLHEQPAKGLAGFQEALTVTSHRTEMPRQNSDPTSENPPLPPRIEKFDRSSWLRQEEDIPPKVTLSLLTFSTSKRRAQSRVLAARCSAPPAKQSGHHRGSAVGTDLPGGCASQGRSGARGWELLSGAHAGLQNSSAFQERKFSSPDRGQNKLISPFPRVKNNLLFK